jgi:hypothetical protein
MVDLVAAMNAGQIGALLIHGANPAYEYFDAAGFINGLKKVRFRFRSTKKWMKPRSCASSPFLPATTSKAGAMPSQRRVTFRLFSRPFHLYLKHVRSKPPCCGGAATIPITIPGSASTGARAWAARRPLKSAAGRRSRRQQGRRCIQPQQPE